MVATTGGLAAGLTMSCIAVTRSYRVVVTGALYAAVSDDFQRLLTRGLGFAMARPESYATPRCGHRESSPGAFCPAVSLSYVQRSITNPS